MTHNHLLSDALTRIRNAQLTNKSHVLLMHSGLVENVSEVLISEGFFVKKETLSINDKKFIKLFLRHNLGRRHINSISVISKPGQRVYKGYKKIPRVKGGLGTVVVSTPSGVMTGHQARNKKIGGEILCKIF